jgi:hypothetical protein
MRAIPGAIVLADIAARNIFAEASAYLFFPRSLSINLHARVLPSITDL